MKKSVPSLGVKALAFVLCVLFSCAAFWSGLYTIAHWDDLWSGGNYYDSYSIYTPLDHYYSQLREALTLNLRKSWGENLTYSEQQRYGVLMATLAPTATNFRYQIHNEDTGALLMDNLDGQQLSDVASRVQGTVYNYTDAASPEENDVQYSQDGHIFLTVNTESGPVVCDPNATPEGAYNAYGYRSEDGDWTDYNRNYDTRVHSVNLSIQYGVVTPFAAKDVFWTDSENYNEILHWLAPVSILSVATLIPAMLLLLFLCRFTGRRKGKDDVALTWQDRVPLDIYAFVSCFLIAILFTVGDSAAFTFNQFATTASFVGLMVFSALVFSLLYAALFTVVARVKSHTFGRNILVLRICRWFWHKLREGFSQWPLIARAVALFVLYLIGTILTGATLLLVPFYQGAVLWALCLYVKQWRAVREGAERMVGGETDYKIDTRHMFPDLKEHAEQLNDLGAGMNKAVQEQIKGERFKAELITNVSHDLKTPLTSIINYVDLLRKTDIQDPTAKEYIDVLDRKSQRLKKLTEDLVEASKASTGNLSVSKERLGFTQLLSQALGEYEEKLSQSGLSVVATMPDHELYVEADGRHLWRVVDNLLGNCAKYAMPETRVYVDVKSWDGCVCLSVKNISRAPLNVPASQLMERFVRGDESRTTEGSGLGLSIAQSLTELQGGAFRIDIDGDLFKAVVTFPEYKEPIPLPEKGEER